MRLINIFICFIVIILVFMGIADLHASKKKTASGLLWPEIKPFKNGYLKVSDIHSLYYEVSGNPKGKAILFLHGGPGGASYPKMRRFADPARFKIILFDQRGAGKSLPRNEIRENRTDLLVEDIERLRRILGLKRFILVGGSWGTTLAVAYAQKYPSAVSALVLRGVFLGTRSEIDHIFHGGIASYFPNAYRIFLNEIPNAHVRPLPNHLFELLQSGDSETQTRVACAWDRYTLRVCLPGLSDQMVEKNLLDPGDQYTLALFEAYYMSNRAFLREDQLLKNAHKISHVPTLIINGRVDFICPPKSAFLLHSKLRKSKLMIVEGAGHVGPRIDAALIKAIDSLK